MPDALIIHNGLIYGVSVAKGELLIVMEKAVFFTKNIHGREKTECVVGRSLCYFFKKNGKKERTGLC